MGLGCRNQESGEAESEALHMSCLHLYLHMSC